MPISINTNYLNATEADYLNKIKKEIKEIDNNVARGEVEGKEMLGWLNLPNDFDRDELDRIKKASQIIRSSSEVFVVIGVGGSYLGARAVIEALRPVFNNDIEILFAGHNLSEKYLEELLNYIADKEVTINVISKSGTTTEPAIAFRFLRSFMYKKYGNKAKNRIFITTDKSKGTLKNLADKYKYEKFVVPEDIGGRYSVLTAVGLLPIAVAGININKLMEGARKQMSVLKTGESERNLSNTYASLRNMFYREGKKIEILASNEPKLHYFLEWWKQLYGESEGKDGKGIFPASLDLTTDLHSMGQYMQQGERILFETMIKVDQSEKNLVINRESDFDDGLDYLDGKSINEINDVALFATAKAHSEGGIPVTILTLDKLDEENVGMLIYFFEKACMISAYLNKVNPFDQPGVEAYKTNMFKVLGKPLN